MSRSIPRLLTRRTVSGWAGVAAQEDVEPRGEFQEVERLGHVAIAGGAQTTPSASHRERAQAPRPIDAASLQSESTQSETNMAAC
jgi:hypothetical protein